MPDKSPVPLSAAAATRLSSWLTHLGVSPLAFDDTIGLINPLLTVHTLHARVIGKHSETPTATTLVLQAGAAFQGFKPGQYLMIEVEINGARHRRAYSPRSIGGDATRFAITVQRQAGGKVSNHVNEQIKVGDVIEIGQAGGSFTLPERAPAELLLIAGGSGITPCMSMLEHLERTGAGTRVTLVYFARSEADRIFAQALQALASKWPGLNYVPQDSAANTNLAGSSPQAVLDEALLDRVMPSWRQANAYCCGPAPLMDAARTLWRQGGIKGSLQLEAFAAVRPSGDPSVRHHVHLARRHDELNFDAPATETLLVAGEQAGFAIKHGCRQGICHECTCRLNEGAVRDLGTGEQITANGQTVRLCMSAALSDLQLEALT